MVMEVAFMDETIVRLRSLVHGMYVHADEDWKGVSTRPERASLNAAWIVHCLQRDGTNYVLLRSAAYGRYLAIEPDVEGEPRRGVRQRDYDDPEQGNVLWEVVKARGLGANDVFIRHGRQHPWYLGVAVLNDDDRTLSNYWMVEILLPRLESPRLPDPPPAALPVPGVEQPVELSRIIFYVLGDDLGRFEVNAWRMCNFKGRSVYKLREKLARRLGFEDPDDITLCSKAGSQARLTHLAIDLPANDYCMEIVVLRTYSTADWRLHHPDVVDNVDDDVDDEFE